LRRTLLRVLRATHLIQFADYFIARRAARASAQANADYRAAHPQRAFPDPALIFEVAGHAVIESFDSSGEAHARELTAILGDANLGDAPAILDWGCGPARVLAHLPAALNTPGALFFGCDPNRGALAHARAAFPDIAFTVSPDLPPLPYSTNSFDAIYGISILTHLPEAYVRAWIAELARIIRPGGVLVLTSHGEHSAQRLPDRDRVRVVSGAFVEHTGAAAGSRTYVSYFNEAAGRRLFEPHFAEIEYRPQHIDSAIGQDIWVLRAPRRPAA
jgi:SAM-dependent methyltransferase